MILALVFFASFVRVKAVSFSDSIPMRTIAGSGEENHLPHLRKSGVIDDVIVT